MKTTPRPLSPYFLLAVRCVVGSLWLYEGLWMKLWLRDPHQLAIVGSFALAPPLGLPPFSPQLFMSLIGSGETLLALGFFSGLWPRFVAGFAGALLLVMNLCGIVFGGGNIAQPIDLLIHNLPFLLCIALLGIYGAGAGALRFPQRKEPR